MAVAEVLEVAEIGFEKPWCGNTELKPEAAEQESNLLLAALGTHCSPLTLNTWQAGVEQNKQILDQINAPSCFSPLLKNLPVTVIGLQAPCEYELIFRTQPPTYLLLGFLPESSVLSNAFGLPCLGILHLLEAGQLNIMQTKI